MIEKIVGPNIALRLSSRKLIVLDNPRRYGSDSLCNDEERPSKELLSHVIPQLRKQQHSKRKDPGKHLHVPRPHQQLCTIIVHDREGQQVESSIAMQDDHIHDRPKCRKGNTLHPS